MVQRILHLDDAVLVIDKPAGLAVHRGPRGGASLEDWLPLLRLGKRREPQPAHRLDADTAGCLVLGRTKPALAALGALFAEGRVAKTYWAVVQGRPPAPEGETTLPLRKVSSAAAGWRMETHPQGQAARTAWRMLGEAGGRSWLELRPATGRTHQLRVHCAALGCPILGDPVYGAGGPGGLLLLARAVGFAAVPGVLAAVAAEAPPPPAMAAALEALA